MLNTGEVCCCRFSADVKSKYYSKNNVLNILQYKSNNIKQEEEEEVTLKAEILNFFKTQNSKMQL